MSQNTESIEIKTEKHGILRGFKNFKKSAYQFCKNDDEKKK